MNLIYIKAGQTPLPKFCQKPFSHTPCQSRQNLTGIWISELENILKPSSGRIVIKIPHIYYFVSRGQHATNSDHMVILFGCYLCIIGVIHTSMQDKHNVVLQTELT